MNHNYTGTVYHHELITTDDGVPLVDVNIDGEWGGAHFSLSPESVEKNFPMGTKVIMTITTGEDEEPAKIEDGNQGETFDKDFANGDT